MTLHWPCISITHSYTYTPSMFKTYFKYYQDQIKYTRTLKHACTKSCVRNTNIVRISETLHI